MTNPRPCPFCGHLPAVETIQREGVSYPAFTIRCVNGQCEVRPGIGPVFTMLSSVVQTWNERRRKPAK